MNEDVTTEVTRILYGMPWDKMFDQPRRVFDANGICPTLHTCGGGNLEIKIILYEDE